MNKVLVITGMTATGKSKLAIKLAQRYNGEIISADSVAIYRQMNIGSAKPTQQEQDGVIHHLIDELDYREQYNVRDFQQQARALIESITDKQKLPIIVGGTGLYLRALLYDYHFSQETETDPLIETYSASELIDYLRKEDPQALLSIHPNNLKRLKRALQRARSQPAQPAKASKLLYDAKVFICHRPRAEMYESINQRVDQMIEQGLEAEVRDLVHQDSDWLLGSMSAIGYREFRPYFDGEITKEECVEQIKKDTRNFAKRQVTWFTHQIEGTWLTMPVKNELEIEDEINEWLEKR